MADKKKVQGSITVFLTMIFLLLFSLLGITFDHVRVMASHSYLRMAAHSAAMTIFGNYNRELYQDYGLYAYGGVNGMGAAELEQELQSCLEDNLVCAAAGKENKYSDLYRFQEVQYSVKQTQLLTDSEIFYSQLEAFLKANAVRDLSKELLDKVSKQADDTEIKDKLAMTKDFEDGKYDNLQEDDSNEDKKEKLGTKKEDSTNTIRKKNELKTEKELQKDAAKGNPLEIFSDIAKTGILSLVCDTEELKEGKIEPCELSERKENLQDTNSQAAVDSSKITDKQEVSILGKGKTKAADYLNQILRNSDNSDETIDKSLIEKGKNKVTLISYSDQQLSSFVDEKERTTKYGLEYLVAGNQTEKDNLSSVVNRLLATRLLLNFSYVVTDAGLQSKSLATATAIAGFTGLTPVIKAVQYTILLILSFQEACIDVTALLDGCNVPLLKNATNFKMNYEEICVGTKSLFQSKAKEYQHIEKKSTIGEISYKQYLWIFLLFNKESTIQKRIYDLVQFDLREKYNQSFCIDSCICRGTYNVSYQIPAIFQELPLLDAEEHWNLGERNMEVRYGYKSK